MLDKKLVGERKEEALKRIKRKRKKIRRERK